MNSLREALNDYLAMRRGLGFKTRERRRLLVGICHIFRTARSCFYLDPISFGMGATADWDQNQISLLRSKQRCHQIYPLTASVGNAIAKYLLTVRPQCLRRELFLTLRQPYRPLSCTGLFTVVRNRMIAFGIECDQRGPHALRHACAARLVQQGFSLKEVGDGNSRSPQLSNYTHLRQGWRTNAVREVAAVDLGGVL